MVLIVLVASGLEMFSSYSSHKVLFHTLLCKTALNKAGFPYIDYLSREHSSKSVSANSLLARKTSDVKDIAVMAQAILWKCRKRLASQVAIIKAYSTRQKSVYHTTR